MKIVTKWENDLPLFTSINRKTGAVMIIEKERFFELDPLSYQDSKWKIKQKSKGNGMIVAGYSLKGGECVFLSNEKEKTKLQMASEI